jgi:transcriptional regulator with XRE-family HTH domain
MGKENGGLSVTATRLNLDDYCKSEGYSNESLAHELDVSRATIFNWKRDERNLPRIVSLALLALQLDPALRKTERHDEVLPTKQYRRSSYATPQKPTDV